MEITVDRESMIEEIESEKTEYETKFTESVELYKTKLGEYARYVEKVSQTNPMDGLKHPPNPPTSYTETFEESLEMLNAHVGATLKMSNNEYRNLREGIKQAHFSNASTSTALSSLSY